MVVDVEVENEVELDVLLVETEVLEVDTEVELLVELVLIELEVELVDMLVEDDVDVVVAAAAVTTLKLSNMLSSFMSSELVTNSAPPPIASPAFPAAEWSLTVAEATDTPSS